MSRFKSRLNYERFFFKNHIQLRNFLKLETKELKKSPIREEFKTFKMVYSLQATVAARGYHVYKNTTWDQAKVGDKVLVEI